MTGWSVVNLLDQPRLWKLRIRGGSGELSFRDVLALWQSDDSFSQFFNTVLAMAPFEAVRWETPAVTTSSADRPFEFVLHDAPGLLTRADPRAFREHFRDAGPEGVVSFENLGRDALLVVPSPLDPAADYAHLAAFVRTAPATQTLAFWRRVGQTLASRLGDRPLWLSTAGMGVPWLHARLDSRPKYYGYLPYARPE